MNTGISSPKPAKRRSTWSLTLAILTSAWPYSTKDGQERFGPGKAFQRLQTSRRSAGNILRVDPPCDLLATVAEGIVLVSYRCQCRRKSYQIPLYHPCMLAFIVLEDRQRSTHKIGTFRSKTAGSTSRHMSTSDRIFRKRKPYGASPRRRQKKDLVAKSDLGMRHALTDSIPPENTIPLGFHDRSAILVVQGSSSAKTPRDRRRRRIR